MSIELLKTDWYFLSVLVVAIFFIIKGYRRQHIKAAFKSIFSKPIAVSASVILVFFLIIGVLDSVRYKNNTEQHTISLLDRIMTPLNVQYEKTYSAPLSLHLFASETIFTNEKVTQTYPRLTYPPHNLQNADDTNKLIWQVISKVACISLIILVSMWAGSLLLNLFLGKKGVIKISSASISFYLTLFICLFILLSSYWLSRYLHLFGTGKIGQDIFYYAIKSIRTGLVIGILTTMFMMPLALLLGIAAGYFGGFIDDIIQYIYTTLSSIPGVLLITASILSMQTYITNHPNQFKTLVQTADARLLALCFILGITSWTSLCRLLRAESLKLREVDYVLAAKALGTSSFKIIVKHLLPNVMHIIVITLVLDFSFLVLAEAVLSYVGVGVSPLTISWGNMINAARLELAREPIVWWPIMAAFICMFILVLASNLFADAVRDAFDPRQSE